MGCMRNRRRTSFLVNLIILRIQKLNQDKRSRKMTIKKKSYNKVLETQIRSIVLFFKKLQVSWHKNNLNASFVWFSNSVQRQLILREAFKYLNSLFYIGISSHSFFSQMGYANDNEISLLFLTRLANSLLYTPTHSSTH